MIHTLIWKFVLIAFTRLDTCGERPDTDSIAKSVLYRSAVRLEAYAHRMKAQHLHATSQFKQQMLLPPARTGPIGFISGGYLNEDAGQRMTSIKKARMKKIPARPTMLETLRRPKQEVLK